MRTAFRDCGSSLPGVERQPQDDVDLSPYFAAFDCSVWGFTPDSPPALGDRLPAVLGDRVLDEATRTSIGQAPRVSTSRIDLTPRVFSDGIAGTATWASELPMCP